MCDKWIHIVNGILIAEHKLTHSCYYYFRLYFLSFILNRCSSHI